MCLINKKFELKKRTIEIVVLESLYYYFLCRNLIACIRYLVLLKPNERFIFYLFFKCEIFIKLYYVLMKLVQWLEKSSLQKIWSKILFIHIFLALNSLIETSIKKKQKIVNKTKWTFYATELSFIQHTTFC